MIRPEPIAAEHVYVAYKDRGRVEFDEVLCQRHFESRRSDGAYDQHADDRKHTITIRPWNGEPRCTDCEDEANREPSDHHVANGPGREGGISYRDEDSSRYREALTDAGRWRG